MNVKSVTAAMFLIFAIMAVSTSGSGCIYRVNLKDTDGAIWVIPSGQTYTIAG